MIRLKLISLSIFLSQLLISQSIVNGSFENNTANNTDQINLSNAALNAMLPDVNAFGSYGDVDIIKTANYGGSGAQEKTWYLGITGGGTDIIALSLSEKLIANKTYILTFYDRKHNAHPANPIQIGVSETNLSFGIVVYTSPQASVDNVWTQRTCTFTAPSNANFITVQMPLGTIAEWVNIDNFVLIPFKYYEKAITKTILKDSVLVIKPVKDSIIVKVTIKDSVIVKLLKKDSVFVKTNKKIDSSFVKFVPLKKIEKHKLNNRLFTVQETVTVNEHNAKLNLWDNNTVDGDMVNIYLNGQLIAQNIIVTKLKQQIDFILQSGSNIIVMEAINLGTVPPNTATFTVNNKCKSITLISDLKNSGAIQIICTADELTVK